MVAINEILLRECSGEECGGETDICTDSRVHHRNAENRAPVTRNRRSAPARYDSVVNSILRPCYGRDQ